MELSLWDTAGQEEFDRLRSLSYDDTQAIMLCFSVDNPGSLENVSTKWIAEINEHCPGVKIVLCALKCDLREEHEKEDDEENTAPPRPMIQYNEGLEAARRIGALRYLGTVHGTLHLQYKANKRYRVLGNAKPRRQRSIHGSRTSRITGQAGSIKR
jgi:Rho family protein